MKYIILFIALVSAAYSQGVDSTATKRPVYGTVYQEHPKHVYIKDTVTFELPRWEDLREQPILINPVGAVASPTRDVATGRLLFNGTTDNAIALYFQTSHMMRRNYDSIYFHCHWRKTTAAAGSVTWTVHVQRINIADTAVDICGTSESFVTLIEDVPAGETTVHALSGIGMLNSDIDHSAILYVQLIRDASADGYDADVELMYVDIHIPVDKLGSKSPIPTDYEE